MPPLGEPPLLPPGVAFGLLRLGLDVPEEPLEPDGTQFAALLPLLPVALLELLPVLGM
ncbi:MAG TPA: hypothetical protein VL966_08380 [Alphaproteobacteria bacterium]|jgi:hypothetical protein|nr:hypothetical protein [Alphaproteobacteria bacterium]